MSPPLWSEIDWAAHTAKIQRQQRRGIFFVPKTSASQRTIELPASLLALLESWRKRICANEHDLVCPSVLGKPMQSSALLSEDCARRYSVRVLVLCAFMTCVIRSRATCSKPG